MSSRQSAMPLVSVVTILVLTIGGLSAQTAQAQERATNAAGQTVWDGVYTDAQASRGKTEYEASCRSCHRGGPRTGEEFMKDWSGSDVQSLFNQIKESMPAGAPSSLSDAAYRDIVAYMLQVNTFPPGGAELDAGAIRRIRIEGRDGPGPVPNFALIRAVGCLAQGPDTAWLLSNANEPLRTKEPAASKDDELRESQAAGLGTQTFRLLNVYPTPDPYQGHKVEAKGFLIRDPGGNRINVTSVSSLTARCDPAN